MRRSLWLLPFILIAACDPNRVYEENVDLEKQQWVKDQVVPFEFEIQNNNTEYNVYANFRNAMHYPFHNLYYQYELKDTAELTVAKDLQNAILFEPKTGKPFGEGLGDMFDHRQLILENYQFPYAGEFTLELQQYMRRDTLPLILSVGVRVEKAENSAAE